MSEEQMQETGAEIIKARGYRGRDRRNGQEDFEGEDQRDRPGSVSGLVRWLCGGIIAAAATITAANTLGPYIPETSAHAAEAHAALNQRVDTVENDVGTMKHDVGELKRDVGGILTSGKKTQLLATRSRMQEIKERMSQLATSSEIYKDYKRELLELEDDEETLRKELGR